MPMRVVPWIIFLKAIKIKQSIYSLIWATLGYKAQDI